MTITSFSFFVFVAVGVSVYYILPKAFQWAELLIFSIIFYVLAATPNTFAYVMVSTALVWYVTNGIEDDREKNGEWLENQRWRRWVVLAISVNVVLWFVFKGRRFITSTQWILGKWFPVIASLKMPEYVAALGMGYYTLQLIGYTLDCYWGNEKAQRNPLKLLLFACFFPQMITGPISRYEQLQGLYERHRLSYINIAHGTQRILWGLFKKLVLAERCGVIVDGIWSDFTTYNGLYTWVALLLYPIQMYADFSGCMDIVIGVAELFDIKLTENFNNPFFSRTSQEFWQRWHISLGNWAKDYVLYPVLKSAWMIRLGKFLRNRFGKNIGKFLATAVGMFVLWMVMGIWHGAYKYILGVSLWYWTILMLGALTRPYTDKLVANWGFKTESFGWRLFQSIRTYFIYAIGAVFFRASGIHMAIRFFKAVLATFRANIWNPWIFFDGSVLNLGITHKDLNIMIISVVVLLVVAVLREKYGYARCWVDQQSVGLRWSIYFLLLFAVLIFGEYGPGYEASEFIYGQF